MKTSTVYEYVDTLSSALRAKNWFIDHSMEQRAELAALDTDLTQIEDACHRQFRDDAEHTRQHAIDACIAIRPIAERVYDSHYEFAGNGHAAAAVIGVMLGELRQTCVFALRTTEYTKWCQIAVEVRARFSAKVRQDMDWDDAFDLMRAMQMCVISDRRLTDHLVALP